MFTKPSRVRNMPEGAEVGFSLPFCCGATPAMRWFDTVQAIVASVASSIDTSMTQPRTGAFSAAVIASAAVRPPTVSDTG